VKEVRGGTEYSVTAGFSKRNYYLSSREDLSDEKRARKSHEGQKNPKGEVRGVRKKFPPLGNQHRKKCGGGGLSGYD